jgi:hypothetical protein
MRLSSRIPFVAFLVVKLRETGALQIAIAMFEHGQLLGNEQRAAGPFGLL